MEGPAEKIRPTSWSGKERAERKRRTPRPGELRSPGQPKAAFPK